jgi:LuxR family maltose regulon positive regulatory protein
MGTTILIVDDHPVFRKGLRLLLEEQADLRVAGEAGDGQTAKDLARELSPDVVIMDITMPKVNGVEATRQILSESPDTRIIALSIHGEKRFIEQMLEAGAAGYLLKDSIPEELVNGVRAVMHGEVVLSAAVAGVVVSEYRKALSNGKISEEQEEISEASPILRTKLHPPFLPTDLVPRPHLLARLEKGLSCSLTLVSAPAGYGKTTLLAAWVASSERRSAWLQLGEEDSDPVVFIGYLLTAVQTLFPDLGGATLAAARAPSRPSLRVLARSLLNELDQIEEPFVLVLDDYHIIHSEQVHELVAALISQLPPNMHLAIATRSDPPLGLASLRARRSVAEIRSDDLRFRHEEAHTFLKGMVRRELSRGTTDLLRNKTEGWIVGLRLAALSMRGLPDVEAFVQRFEGTSSAYVADYLLGEVLARQRPEVRSFLLRISILDRFCASLCDAVLDDTLVSQCTSRWSGTDDSSSTSRVASQSGAMLDELYQRNLFLVSLDPELVWYRFHHLFQDLLCHQLASVCSATEVAALHARASAWYAEHGHVDEALDHALAAGDVEGAVQIVERERTVVLVDDQWHVLARWLDRLPEDIRWQRFELLLAEAWVCFHRADVHCLLALLEDPEAWVGDGPGEPRQGEIDFLRGYLSWFQGLGPEALEYHASAREKIPDTYCLVKAEAELHYALALHMNGRKEMAVNGLTDLIRSRRLTKAVSRVRLWAGLSFIALLEGDLAEVIYPVRQWHELAVRDKNLYTAVWGSYLEACTYFCWNDMERAVELLEQLAAQLYIMNNRPAVDGLCALCLAHERLQHPDQADGTFRVLLEFVRQANDPTLATVASSCQARLSLLRGDTASAVQWLRTADLAGDAGIMLWLVEVPRLTECRVLVAQGSDASLHQAIDKLEHYDQENKAVHNIHQRITILSLLALATQKQGRSDKALAILGRAVALAERGGFIQPFVEPGAEMAALLQELVARDVADSSLQPATASYLNRVFAAFAEAATKPEDADIRPKTQVPSLSSFTVSPSSPQLVESLTEREMEVLALLAQRLTNQEIAQELVISLGTVKQHTHNIYGKLGVQDRRQAVARAQALDLLSPA